MFLGQPYQRGTVLLDRRARAYSEALNLEVSVVDQRAQRWDVELVIQPTDGFTRRFMAHRARERWSSFAIPCPQLDNTGTYPDATRLNLQATANAGTGTVQVRKGSAANVLLRTGRFISFAGHSKVYQVTLADDLTIDDNTTAHSITFTPELRANVASGSYIRLNPDITVRYDPAEDWFANLEYLFGETIYLQEVL